MDRDDTQPAGSFRVGAAVAAALLAASVVPPFLADRYVEAAYEGWRTDPEQAQTHLDRARDLNRLSIEPLLAEGGIARERGDREQAIAAFEEAVEERPEDWAAYYFLAELKLRSDPEAAREHLDRGLELNPYGIELLKLEQELER
jgi:tetratricopeptide (TPR) repeat protein